MRLLRKLHDSGKHGRMIAYALAYIVITPFWISGLLLFWALRPIVALSHLLMGNINTAKHAITEINPSKSIQDW
jgi:hypothetical protein